MSFSTTRQPKNSPTGKVTLYPLSCGALLFSDERLWKNIHQQAIHRIRASEPQGTGSVVTCSSSNQHTNTQTEKQPHVSSPSLALALPVYESNNKMILAHTHKPGQIKWNGKLWAPVKTTPVKMFLWMCVKQTNPNKHIIMDSMKAVTADLTVISIIQTN